MTEKRTPLPERDPTLIDAFWRRYLASSPSDRTFTEAECFGDSIELADKLIALVIDGPKRATAGSVAEYEADDCPLPEVGDEWIACDGHLVPRAVLLVTDVRVGPLSSVDDAFAWDEGEGERTRADWLRAHTAYFTRSHAALGIEFHEDIPVVFERFDVVYVER